MDPITIDPAGVLFVGAEVAVCVIIWHRSGKNQENFAAILMGIAVLFGLVIMVGGLYACWMTP